MTGTLAAAEPSGPHLLRDDKGKVLGVAGIGDPCDVSDVQCQPYIVSGTVTKVDRGRDGTPQSFALRLPSDDQQLENFDDTHLTLSRGDLKDFSHWFRPGLHVTVSGNGGADTDSAVVDRVAQAQ